MLGCGICAALDPSSVVVLYSDSHPDSLEIANHYAQVHPGVRLLGLSGVSTQEQITHDHYLDVIRPQVLAGIDDGTELIVTTKGLPLRILNTTPNPGTYDGWRGSDFGMSIPHDWWKPYSSLESELTRVDRIDSAEQMGDQGFLFSTASPFNYDSFHQAANPYFGRWTGFDRSDPANEGIRLTARLDGFTVNDVIASIDRAQQSYLLPSANYVVVDDDPNAPGALADLMPELVADVLEPSQQGYLYDSGTAHITAADEPVLGYVSHGSQAAGPGYIQELDFNMLPGALMHTWESFNAYSFREGANRYGQGLAGDWLTMGGTAAIGTVEEPKASRSSVANEDILFDMLLQGYTLAEAAWSATNQLSFVNTVVGDPLMRWRDWVPGDTNLDGVVNIVDLNAVLGRWNKTATPYDLAAGEVTGDGFVGIQDLILVTTYWQSGTAEAEAGQGDPVPAPRSVTVLALLAGLMLLRRAGAGRPDGLRP
jgi:uncharacterized protein (TIGR03790 family)